jgi:hypothetical protein
MRDGRAKLDEQIARLRGLIGMPARVAPKVATVVDRKLRENIAAGIGPDGKPWALTQDGKVPLRNAGKSLTVSATGPVVLARVNGVEARHHLGAVKGGIIRRILPTKRMLAPMTAAIREVLAGEFRATMKSGGAK